MTEGSGISLAEALNKAKLGRFQIQIMAICFAVAMLDGFDTQSIAFVAPALKTIWAVPAGEFGVLFSAGLFGTMLGAIGLGALADRVGRKTIIVISVLTFSVMSLLSATASSTEELIVYRFITGLGLGGAIPNIIALTSEYAPTAVRTTVVTVMFTGFPLGAVLGGIVSAQLLAVYGWPSVFLLGGILPLLLLPVILLWLPESVRYLAVRRKQGARVAAIMQRIDPGIDWNMPRPTHPDEKARPPHTVRDLFTEGRTAWTLLLWTLVFMSLLLTYFLVSWIPSLLADAGLGHREAVLGVVVLNIGGIVGSVVIGRISDRYGQFAPLVAGYGIGALAVAAIGVSTYSVPVVMAVIFIAGFCVLGAQLALAALSAKHYPTYMRSTGVGWAMGLGRVGSVVGPVIGGALLAYGLGQGPLFVAAAVPAAIAAVTIFAMSFKVPPRTG